MCIVSAPSLLAIMSGDVKAHEVHHEVVRGKAIAVRAFFGGGEPLAYTEYEIFPPKDPKIPHQKGRTDRSGYLSFVPDASGKWRVRVIEKGGHGLDVEIDASPAASAATGDGDNPGVWARPILGVGIIAAIFAGLYFAGRRRKAPR